MQAQAQSRIPGNPLPAIVAGCAGIVLELAVAALRGSPLHPLLPKDAPVSILSWRPEQVGLGGRQGLVVIVAIVVVIAALGCFLFAAREAWYGNVPVGWALLLAAIFAVAVLFVPLLLSRDVYNYALYGRMVSLYGKNPYTTVPTDVGPGDPFFALSGEKWREIPSVYGPAFSMLSAGVTSAFKDVTRTVLAFRFIAIVASVGTSLLIAFVAKELFPQRAAFAVVLFGWNPVVVFNSVGGGHNDVLVAMCIVGALALVVVRREYLATGVLMLGVLVKASAAIPLLLLLVWVVWKHPGTKERVLAAAKHLAVIVVLGVGFAAPFWQTENPTLGLAEVSTHEGGYSVVTFFFYSIGRGVGALGGWPAQSLSYWVIRMLFLAVLLVVLFRLGRRLVRDDPAVLPLQELGAAWAWGLLAVMLVSPFILPWYIVWVLPLAFLLPKVPRTVAIVLSVAFAAFQVVAEPLRSEAAYDAVTFVRDWAIRPAVGVLLVWMLVDLWRRLRDGRALADTQHHVSRAPREEEDGVGAPAVER